MTAVRVRGLGVVIDGNEILRDVDLDVPRGSWTTVIGPNGAGKSTMLRAIAGLVPHTGTVEVLGLASNGSCASSGFLTSHGFGRRASRRTLARTLATVAQDPVVPPGVTVSGYVLLGRTPYLPPLGRESASDLAAVHAALDRLDLLGFADRRLNTMSGGERQRVFLARALAQGAPLLVLDEPTTALDIGHQQEVLELVDDLRATEGLTVLATMHELSIAGQYADRLVMLAGGTVIADGSAAEVLTEELLSRHYGARVRVLVDDSGRPVVVPARAS